MPGIQHHIIKTPTELLALTNSELLNLGAVYVNHHRVSVATLLNEGDYVRIHTQPKRYPVDKINWRKVILFEDENLIVLDKPYGIPVHPTLDNTKENILVQLSQAYGAPLFHTHRLDIGTQGLLLFAKNQKTQIEINNLFLNRQIKKFYRALTSKPLIPGVLIHFMQPSKRSPKILSDRPLPGYKKCELQIHANLEIELITGRSHQIRAQLAFEKNPILGDTLYGANPTAAPDYSAEFFYLTCVRLELLDGRTFTRPWQFLERADEEADS